MKKLLKKVISLTAALAMAAAYSASAAVTTGGGADSVPYYWLQDFNDYTNTTEDNGNLPSGVEKSGSWGTTTPTKNTQVIGTTAAYSYGSGNNALKAIASGGTKGTNNSYLYIDLEKTYAELFAGGDIILSYDVEFPIDGDISTKNCKFRIDVSNPSGNIISGGSYFEGKQLSGYTGTSNTKTPNGNGITVAANTKYNITLLLHKESDTTVTVKQFCDGVQLVNSSGDPLIVTKDMTTNDLFNKYPRFRFYVYSGTTAIIDNVTIKNFTSEAIETFGDSASVTEEVCTSNSLSLSRSGNKLHYQNTATSELPNLTYKFNNPFDFDGGKKKMLVSFKVELNQDITYIQTKGASHLLAPNVSIGSKTVYMPAIEHNGFRARKSEGGRNTSIPDEYYINTMTRNRVYYNSVLIEYDAASKTLKYTQYVDGKPMKIKDKLADNSYGDPYDVGTFEITGVTEDDLNANISIQFQGRNFKDGGLYIDDLAVTTVDESFTVSQPFIAEDNTVTVGAVNKTENLKPMYIILASYNGTELMDVEYTNVKVNFTDRTYQFTPSGEFTATDATAVKAFAWNGFAGAMPYAANGVKK